MAEPVKIVISETREGNAIDEEQRRIEQLHKAAEQYAKTPGMEGAAKSARAEAMELQKKQLGTRLAQEAHARAAGNGEAADQAAREAKEMERTMQLQRKGGMGYDQAAKTARRQLNQEDEAAALKKAGIEKMGYTRARQEALTLARELATGAPTGRTLSALLGNLIGGMAPEALAAAAGIAAPVALVGGAYLFNRDQREQDYQEQNKMSEEQAGDERAQEIARSPLGSDSGSFQQEVSDESTIKKDEADRGRLEHARKHAWFGLKDKLASLTGGRWKTQEQRDQIDNENEIKRAERDKRASQKSLREQWNTGGAYDEKILEDLSEHSVAGVKKATVDTAKKSWMAAYRRSVAEGASRDDALKISDLTAKQADWERAQARGAGLVNAQTGNAGAAAAARWADTGIVGPGMDALLAEMRSSKVASQAAFDKLTDSQVRVDQSGKPLTP
ncbi:MAG: hypothetical protein ABSE62_00505 [Chthoniobacteraceae bacterium]|jgi:hypothetical protein